MATNKNYEEVRGKARIFLDKSIEFTPYQEGQPQKERVCNNKQSELYKTVGRQPKLVARLLVDSASADPVGDMYDQLEDLAERYGKVTQTEQKARTPKRGRILRNEGGLKVQVGTDLLSISYEISLKEHPDYKEALYNLINETSKCLAFNQSFLSQRLKSLAKSSTRS